MLIINRFFIHMSSYIPLFIFIYVNSMSEFTYDEFLRVFYINKVFWIITVVLSVVAMLTFINWFLSLDNAFDTDHPPQLDLIKSIDDETITFFMSFIASLLSINIESNPSIIINFVFIILICIHFSKRQLLHYNIWLLILGYKIYSDQFEGIVLSRVDLKDYWNESSMTESGYNRYPVYRYYRINK